MEGGRDHPWMALCMEDKPINYGQKKGMKKSNDDVNNVTTKQMNATATEKLKRKKKNIIMIISNPFYMPGKTVKNFLRQQPQTDAASCCNILYSLVALL
mmetsp:Transcript_43297/g.76382  ORF Transcript_43297/g.76382 Transcript_43297/m.76382 type:complete len:99 (+) Transcript_43297:102-398(+)